MATKLRRETVRVGTKLILAFGLASLTGLAGACAYFGFEPGEVESASTEENSEPSGMVADSMSSPSSETARIRRWIDVGRLTKGRGGPVHSAQLRALGYVVGPMRALPPGSAEQYDAPDDEGFHSPLDAPLSTFSIDVDTASYANVRRFLQSDRLPPAGAVRIEELVNYFDYGHNEPEDGVPFGVTTEWATAPWAPDRQLLMIGLKSKALEDAEVPPRNLVFLLDVSGSMQPPDKLPLVKRAMATLVDRLRAEDRVAIVVYAGASGVVLAPTPGDHKQEILSALERLQAGGSTNGGGGIARAYALARETFMENGVNRVILATDGDFNVGVTSRSDLVELIERERDSGVFLTVLGVGTGNLKDATMEELADRGNGNYAYLDSLHEARKVLVHEAGSTLVTVAKDVKLQIEFNPARVESYRLIGYENRRLASRDFRDDSKDAGEIGAGHSVTAFYEIIPTSGSRDGAESPKLRYQARGQQGSEAFEEELCTVKVRFKAPQGDLSEELVRIVAGVPLDFENASEDFRYGASVALFGTLLRHPDRLSEERLEPWDMVRRLAMSAMGEDRSGRRAEFLSLAARARELQPIVRAAEPTT